jgi:hypothetical protein
VFEYRVLSRIFWPKRVEIKGNVENYIMRSLIITKYYSGDQIEKNELGGAYIT